MLSWKKKGLVYLPEENGGWRDNSALTPTAVQLEDESIRVYAGFRDKNGVSRIGFVDVDSDNPLKILRVSEAPALDVGGPGMFDDNGVILGDVIKVGSSIYMYYVGFQLVSKVKFLAYSGLAISTDGGITFDRYSDTPVMDRTDEGKYIRAIHSVLYEDDVYKVWYACGNGWQLIDGKEYPKYDINYVESPDGVRFSNVGKKILLNDASNQEYRIGRPRVFRWSDSYALNFTYGTLDGRYQAGQASSSDGVTWVREDEKLGLKTSQSGWDSIHLSYPSIITTAQGRTFVFYNGNNMGVDGFGFAELDYK